MAVHRGPSTKWLFTREQLENTPSRRGGIEADRELSYRQQAANLIQDIGQRLNVSQLIINTAIVYMHRFYMIHSFSKFHRNVISQTTLFLAAKVEEQPRKLEHVIKIAHACINPQEPALDTKSNAFQQQTQELVALETIVLQTLGFEITVDHPHTDVVRCSQLVRASKDLAQTSYFMATNSLHLTTFCLQYRPTVVACVCIHLACKWSNWEIPVSTDSKHWWEYVDRTVTLQLLDELTHEFLQILEKTPSKLKRIRNWRAIQAAKKPKTEGPTVDSAFQGTSLDGLPGVTNSFFPSTSSDSSDISSHYNIAASYASYQPLSDQSKSCGYDHFSEPHLSDFTLVTKHEHTKAAGGSSSKHQQLSTNAAAAAAFSRPQKVLTLEKYREKHAADLASQNGIKEEPGSDLYAPPPPAHHHKKRSQPQQAGQSGDGRREKSSSKKSRLAPSYAENGSATSEELKMRIKVSSERHGGSEQGGTLPGKDKHKEHGGHRHSKHGHSHAYSLSGNGRGTIENASLSIRAPDVGSSGSSRKRPHSDAGNHNHHHHSSKSGRSSKGGLSSAHYASESGQRMMEHHGHDGTNGMLTSNGQHTDYKDTFDMLDSLLSAQGMNL
ncbi:cyclin-T2-like isoform X1 [Centropristis striata]|uniref:cyclin-T2-like isoform X1 n=1 Tax=Centropristis striata TaxID=184440 RepID=UPI0027E039CA|nr:cyclin-T2-like isoform X1 [Centropristis striata]